MSIYSYGGGVSGTQGTQTGVNDPPETPAGTPDQVTGGSLTEQTSQDIQDQLDAADTTLTFKSATQKSELQRDLDLTAAAAVDESVRNPDSVGTGEFALDKFLEVIAKTWPRPEIISINFGQQPGQRVDKIRVKVQVTGDFLSDEWFWADFLKYFKLRVYMVPELTGQNKDIYDVSLFHEITSTNVRHMSPIDQPITSLENRSGKLENLYIFESTLDLVKDRGKTTEVGALFSGAQENQFSIGSEAVTTEAVLQNVSPEMRSGIVARTYFDKNQFKEELLGKEADPILEELRPLINGKWDLVEFDTDAKGKVTSSNRYYGRLSNTNTLWNSAFAFSDEKKEYLATDNPSRYFESPAVVFNREPFTKSNWPLLLMEFEAKKTINKDFIGEMTNLEDLNPNRKPKFEFNETLAQAFSEAYIAKQTTGEVNVSFSFDYLELFKHLSQIPDEIFNNIQKNIQGNIIRKINIIDEDGKFLEDGIYQYMVDIRVESRIDQYVGSSVEMLKEALSNLEIYMKQAAKEESTNKQAGELSEAFIASEGAGTQANITKAVEMLYNVLETNLLDFFIIKSFILKRRRIKDDDINVAKFDTSKDDHQVTRAVDIDTIGTTSEFTDTPDLFTEFGTEDLIFDFASSFSFTRDQALQYATPENLAPDFVQMLQKIILDYEQDLLSLIRQESTPSALSEIPTGRRSNTNNIVDNTILLQGTYDAKKSLTGLVFGEPLEINILKDSENLSINGVKYKGQDIIQDAAVDNYIISNLANIGEDISTIAPTSTQTSVGNVMFTNLATNEGYDFEFVQTGQTEETETTIAKEANQVEVLDIEEQKYTTSSEQKNSTEQIIKQQTTQNFFNEISNDPEPAPTIELQYLEGYNTDENGKSIMKEPIFVSTSNLTEEDQGRELLFRAKIVEKGVELPIYNEYFVTKV